MVPSLHWNDRSEVRHDPLAGTELERFFFGYSADDVLHGLGVLDVVVLPLSASNALGTRCVQKQGAEEHVGVLAEEDLVAVLRNAAARTWT